jgi:hypothetical protein
VNNFQQFYRKQKGLGPPKTLFAFYRDDNSIVAENGKALTKQAYSAAQAVRFIKQETPKLTHVSLTAKPYFPKIDHIPETPKKPKGPDQLELNI